jgi:hypothetical protein
MMNEVIEEMARAGFNEMFDDATWNALPKNSIDRVLWINIATKMLRSVRFPVKLEGICRELFFEPRQKNHSVVKKKEVLDV